METFGEHIQNYYEIVSNNNDSKSEGLVKEEEEDYSQETYKIQENYTPVTDQNDYKEQKIYYEY